jgi:hypothetical protein
MKKLLELGFVKKNKLVILGLSVASLAMALSAPAQADTATISGTIPTFNADGSFFSDPQTAPFNAVTVGEYDFAQAAVVTGAVFTGNFGSNLIGSATAPAQLFIDGINVATCDANCAAQTQSNDVAWSYTLTAADLVTLAGNAYWNSNRIVMTALQTDQSQIVLDPTTVTLTATVPVPGAVWLFSSALLAVFGINRRKANGTIA